ncbi:transforming growth factor, beta receptor associated protein 1, partial [Dinochytrium kinnereticum]
KFYPLALLFKAGRKHEKALEVWFVQLEKETHEPAFDDADEVVNLLNLCEDKETFLKYLLPTIKRDASVLYKLFELKSRILGEIDISEMTALLRPLGPDVETAYLEHLIRDWNRTEAGMHARLATLYLDQMGAEEGEEEFGRMDDEYRDMDHPRPTFPDFLESMSSTSKLHATRYAFLRLLMASKGATFQEISAAVSSVLTAKRGFEFERAVVMACRKDHETVLRLLGLGIRDFVAAERYCLTRMVVRSWEDVGGVVDEDLGAVSDLLMCLLGLYLDDKEGLAVDCFREAMRILSTHPTLLDPIKVIRLIPAHCSLKTLHPFILQTHRQTLHTSHHHQITKSIVRNAHLHANADLARVMVGAPPIVLGTGGGVCLICRKAVRDPTVFVRLPGVRGDLVHLGCLRRPGG